MSGLPVPPAAYWEQVPWWAFLTLVGILAVLASPTALQLLRGRAGTYATREQAFANERDRLEMSRAKHLAAIEADRDLAHAQLTRERVAWHAERDALERDRDDGWAAARGMEDVAHQQRHDHVATTLRFNAALAILRRAAAGEIAIERTQALVAEITPAPDPPRVPLLRDVARGGT